MGVLPGRGNRGPSSVSLRPARPAFQRGQSIVVALLVLLLLAFVGGLFASIVTRNLRSAARSVRVENADFYAQAGLRFADDQLTHSTDGADWRPPLQYQLATPPADARGLARYNAIKSTLQVVPAQHPDRAFLEQGFASYTIGQGRFLLRLTYTPGPDGTNPAADPRARYIKIESVGRDGVIDATDPTTYSNAPPTRLNATLVEYKAIGITDYARFETNPDKRSDVMALGVASQSQTVAGKTLIVTPGVFDFTNTTTASTTLQAYPIITEYGAADAYLTSASGNVTLNPTAGTGAAAPGGSTLTPGGGSIHANGTVRFYGLNHVYLNNNKGQNSGALGETLEVGGDLLLDNYLPGKTLDQAQDAAVAVFSTAASVTTPGTYVTPSNDPARPFDTQGGVVRDAGTGTDAQGLPRNVARLEPPTLDSTDPVSNLTRYRAITQKSAARTTDSMTGTAITDANAGLDGYGQSIYVNNSSDIQAESSKVLGGATLVDEWLHRTEGRNNWTANFYRPPGVDIVLGRQRVPGATPTAAPITFYGVRLTRTDADSAGQPVYWKNPDGTAGGSGTMVVSYDDLNASNDPATVPTTGAALASYQANPNNDVVIYAEGNVRVRGAASAASGDTSSPTSADTSQAGDDALPRHITIVTNGTAYIDGSLVRGNPDSSISVLAHDYVCVNTTQFLAGAQVDENPVGTRPPDAYADPALRALDFSASDEVLLQEFSNVGTGAAPALYISGGPGASGATQADFDLLDPRTGFSLVTPPGNNPAFTASPISIGAPTYTSTGAGTSTFSHTTYNFTGVTFGTADSQFYQLAVRRDPTPYTVDTTGTKTFDPTATQDFLLERAAILPMDVKIEATLFAQTRSFFVIPGDWFNTSSDDNMAAFTTNYNNGGPTNQLRSGTDASVEDAARYPFYGQPIDLKITLYGSVSEARPAAIDAQTAWMLHWGWIPDYHGSTFIQANTGPGLTLETAGHTAGTPAVPVPAIGLALVYNPLAAYPYNGGGGYYLRTDLYGRPLPSAPKLPVCAGLLYAGQSFDQPILQ